MVRVFVDLDDDFFALTDGSGTHDNANRLGDAALLADDAAHIGLGHLEVVDNSAILAHGINSHLHGLLVLDKAAGNG